MGFLQGLRSSFALMMAAMKFQEPQRQPPSGYFGGRMRGRWPGPAGKAGDKLGKKAFKGQIGIRRGW